MRLRIAGSLDPAKRESLRRQTELVVCLSCHDLGDGVADGDAGLFDVLLGQARGNAHLERGLYDPFAFLRPDVPDNWHALQPRDKHAVGERLRESYVSQPR